MPSSSSDEGEINENEPGLLKATAQSQTAEGGSVDPQDRLRSRSPDYDSASRYSGSSRRSRSPRGYKRSRDDTDHYGRSREHDSRPSRSSYDDRKWDGYQRPRVSYEDLDRPPSRSSHSNYDPRDRDRDRDYHHSDRDYDRDYDRPHHRIRDGERYGSTHNRDRYSEKRSRNNSRSPHRYRSGEKGRLDRFVKESSAGRDVSRELKYDDKRAPGRRGSTNANATVIKTSQSLKFEAKRNRETGENGRHVSSEPPAIPKQPEPSEQMEEEGEDPSPIDEEAEIERRRKRREEILAKSSSATPLLLHAVRASEKVRATSPALVVPMSPLRSQAGPESPQTPQTSGAFGSESPRSPGINDEPSPSSVGLLDENHLGNTHVNGKADNDDGPSAADYDPTVDMKEDERRDELRHGQVVLHGQPQAVEMGENESTDAPPENKPQKALQGEGEDEDDDFDMFAEDFDEDKYATKPAPAAAPLEAAHADPSIQANGGILEGDDHDGYYKIRIGEVLNNRYQVQATLGRGMFSGVVRALDMTTKKSVAIKLMRNNDALRKGGFTEIAILQKLNDADPENRKHIVKFERSFDYRGHLCMAFENLSLNLREVLRKFGNNVGINLGATRTYAYQIFVALAHMRKCSIIHADLKPDNILVNENRNVLKICDLGTAIDRSDAATAQTTVTPYLVSRFYRAPEIILGMPYDYGVDVWSIGCTLYELYTGKILFTGDSNNQMLKAIMEVRGRLAPKLFRRGQLSVQHFDENGQFVSVERDKVLGKTTARTLPMVKPTRDLRTRLTAASSNLNDSEARDLNQFIDLLDHCLALNPEKRIKPTDALKHPFFTSKSTHSARR